MLILDLKKHHTRYLVKIITSRLEVLKKRVLKQYGEDWYDYDDQGIESKIEEKNEEYFRLKQVLDELYKSPDASN